LKTKIGRLDADPLILVSAFVLDRHFNVPIFCRTTGTKSQLSIFVFSTDPKQVLITITDLIGISWPFGIGAAQYQSVFRQILLRLYFVPLLQIVLSDP